MRIFQFYFIYFVITFIMFKFVILISKKICIDAYEKKKCISCKILRCCRDGEEEL